MKNYHVYMPQPGGEALPKVKEYAAVGCCIYCGHDRVTLRPEHIIPFGIAGDSFVLPKASCESCGRKTGQDENKILRNSWWAFRAKIGAPTKKPKDRPALFTLKTVRKGDSGSLKDTGTLQLTAEDYPPHIVAVRFGPAGILEGRSATEQIEGEFWIGYPPSQIKKYSPDPSDGHYLGPFDTGAFTRMLAKIAHSYATAELGDGNFMPYLRKFIRGKTRTPTYSVGGERAVPPPEHGVLHSIKMERIETRGKRFAAVRLRLFAFFGTPVYRIVVGEM